MLKKKIVGLFLFVACLISLTACGKTDLDISKYIIEKRENVFIASDDIYNLTFSTGLRESNYNFDGVVSELVPFGVITLSRKDNQPLANDSYSYLVTINDQKYSGFLQKSYNDNSCSTDLEVNTLGDENINVQISFTGYTFNQNLENVSRDFQVDSDGAISVTQQELKDEISNLARDKNNKIEVVMKIMKDYSSDDLKKYYWYVGIISTNGETMGILIDANNGEVIAKKI